MKLCKDCKHYKKRAKQYYLQEKNIPYCTRVTSIDPVEGGTVRLFRQCKLERETIGLDSYCGSEAKYYETM